MYCDGWALSAARSARDSWGSGGAGSGCICSELVWTTAGGVASEAVEVREGERRAVEVARLRVTRGRRRRGGIRAARNCEELEARGRRRERWTARSSIVWGWGRYVARIAGIGLRFRAGDKKFED